MGRLTAFLSEIDLEDLRQAGGKGANLGYLIHSGFPVPHGFCVLARAFETFLEAGGLGKRLRSIVDAIDFGDLEDVQRNAATLKGEILSTPMPASVEGEVAASYRSLISGANGKGLVAVRSSAGTRDLSITSFPGQMDTYHNLLEEGEVIDKVRKCWASLFGYAALVSRQALGIDHFSVFIAPIVQLMVASDCAGVVFTANPLSGQPDQMVINSCFGLGEGVVSGALNCDHFLVDKTSAATLEEKPGDKDFKIALDTARGKGNINIPLSGEERLKPSLTEAEIRELVKTARDIEACYDQPQDIEWAFSGGKLFILQSRSMNGLVADRTSSTEEREWVSEFDSAVDPDYPNYTLSNISEVLPGVLTPLSISDIDFLDYGFVKCNSDLGLMKGIRSRSEYTYLGIFYGRVHLNLSIYRAAIFKVPGGNVKEFDRRATEEIEEDEAEGWRPTPASIAALPGIFARMIYRAAVTPKEVAALGREYQVKLGRLRRLDYERMPYQEVFAILEDIRKDLFRVLPLHIGASQFATTYYDQLGKATARWLGDADRMLAARLVTGLRDIESALPSVPIWDLSRMVKDSDALREIFESNPPEQIEGALEGNPLPEIRVFLKSLHSFLDRFGYRGVFESEAMLRNWEEDPSYVYAMIRNYLDADPSFSPRELFQRQEMDREEAVCEVMHNLKGSRRLLLRYLLRQAQTYISQREFVKSLIVKDLNHSKKVFRIVSRRLAAEGLLGDPEDIYFLTHTEIADLATGRAKDMPVDELVSRRRSEYERNLTVVLPEYSLGRPKPLTAGEMESREDIKVLEGIGVSPGRVTGRARVIIDPRRNAEMQPGEILVAPVTDAAWTPLFVTAAATVVDVGGPLSHGSIVAREFGIPCVVNVRSATGLIRNGQIITVDGGQGKVYLHPSKEV